MSWASWLCPSTWRWSRKVESTTDEAKQEMARLEEHDASVKQLGADLRRVRQHNNFSGMVEAAIRHSPRSQ